MSDLALKMEFSYLSNCHSRLGRRSTPLNALYTQPPLGGRRRFSDRRSKVLFRHTLTRPTRISRTGPGHTQARAPICPPVVGQQVSESGAGRRVVRRTSVTRAAYSERARVTHATAAAAFSCPPLSPLPDRREEESAINSRGATCWI